MSDEPRFRPEIYDTTPGNRQGHAPLPSECRDFVPTPAGWAGIIAATCVLAWMVWYVANGSVDVLPIALSVAFGYGLAAMAWGAIRRARDEREDRRCRE